MTNVRLGAGNLLGAKWSSCERWRRLDKFRLFLVVLREEVLGVLSSDLKMVLV